MKISTYFTLKEVEYSRIGDSKGIDNTITPKNLDNARYASSRLDLIREKIGLPFFVTSWYRSSVLNKMIGGADNSRHLTGLAIDFYCKENLLEIFNKIVNLKANRNISYDQCYYDPVKKFIHISFCMNLEDERGMSWIK